LTDARPPPFPWGAALHFGLGLLRLAPANFWTMTPCELMALSGGSRPAATATDRNSLEAMMARWPDTPAKGDGNGTG
jgi:uncharacterized phage protein (TIGR02216 family)